MDKNYLLIQQLVDVFNGYKQVNLCDLVAPNFRYVTNLGSNYDLADTLKIQQHANFYCQCRLFNIKPTNQFDYRVMLNVEFIDPAIKYRKILPAIMLVKTQNSLLSYVEISYQISKTDSVIVKSIRAKTCEDEFRQVSNCKF